MTPEQDNEERKNARDGSSIRSLFASHINELIEREVYWKQDEYPESVTPIYRQVLTMLSEMEISGYFADGPHPITLHHWGLEPRNIMVSQDSGGNWKISGIIDWDDALAVPRPLGRQPPIWIWHFPEDDPSASKYYNDDQFMYQFSPEISADGKILKTYFDEKVDRLLPGYTKDAYGRGLWLRRIWSFVKGGVWSEYVRGFFEQLPKDWDARHDGKILSKPDVADAEEPESGESPSEHCESELKDLGIEARETEPQLPRGFWTSTMDWIVVRIKALYNQA